MKIVITGASGFIGEELIHELLTHPNVEIIALTRGEKECTSSRIEWEKTDYSIDSLSLCFQGAYAVIHLAAVRGTSGSIGDYHINECITENVLIAMNAASVKKIIFASSIAVYSDVKAIPWTESDIMMPKTLYGISKASCEHLCMYYARKLGFHYIIFRIAQVLGESESKPGMMNTFINHAYKKEQLTVVGKSVAKRQYVYVRDLTKMIAETLFWGSDQSVTLNIGMDQAYSNLEIAQIVNRVFKNDKPVIYKDNCDENIESSCMDISRAGEMLMVHPRNMETSLNDIKESLYENIPEHY